MQKSWVGIVWRFASMCKVKILFSIVCSIISVIGGVLPYVGVYNIISLMISGSGTSKTIMQWTVICALGYLIKIVFFGISTVMSHISAYSILENIRIDIADRLEKAPLGFVMDNSIGKIKSVMVDRVETIEKPLAHIIPEGIANILLAVGIFVYMWHIDWRMAIAGLITIPIAGLAYSGALKSYKVLYDGYMETNNYVNGVIVEYIEGIEVIKAFNQSSRSYEKYTDAVNRFLEYTLKWFEATWKGMNYGAAILPSTLIGTVPIGLYLYSKGQLLPADMIITIILSMGLIAPLMTFTAFINDMSSIKYAVLDAEAYLNIEALPQASRRVDLKDYGIDFKNVSFSYHPQKGDYVLENINFSVPYGKYYALIGPSGGGKSTITRLINRFWDVTEGEVSIGGVNIKDIPLKQLSECIAFVTQDNFLFDCSIKENIRMGNKNATDDEIMKAAKLAQCGSFVSRLEKGYDTPAGEAGGRLSGGEKQRIAIARAIVKNAPIVILDEATAFTDPESEKQIQESLAVLTKNKTVIVIAHRLSTVKDADALILLRDGQIHAVGTHDELLEENALYKDMWTAHIGAKVWHIPETAAVVGGNYA